jgi:hypothetical protein
MNTRFKNICLYAIITTMVMFWNFHLTIALKHPAASLPPPIAALYSASTPDEVSDQQIDPFMVKELTLFAHELANAAGDAIMPYWRQRGVEVESKKERGRSISQKVSPVTIADRSAEMVMRQLIET